MDTPTTPTLLSSCMGGIDKVLLCFPDYEDIYFSGLIAHLFDFLEKFPTDTQFILACHPARKAQIERLIGPRHIRSGKVEIFDFMAQKISIWIQDAFWVLQCKNENYFIENCFNENWKIVNELQDRGHGKCIKNNCFKLEGGDLLVGSQHVLIGIRTMLLNIKNSLRSNNLTLGILIEHIKSLEINTENTAIEFFKLLRSYTAKKSISTIGNVEYYSRLDKVVGSKDGRILERCQWEFDFHIDRLITMLGPISQNGPDCVFVADPVRPDKTSCPELSYLRACLDLVEQDLSQKGIRVVRNPVPIDKSGKNCLVFNNCIVENQGQSGRTVWLPTFKNDIDQAYYKMNKEIWESLGFSVIPLIDFSHISENQNGAAHCIIKILKRKHYDLQIGT